MCVSLLVNLLPYWYYINKEYLQFWIIYISEICWDILRIFLNYFQNILYFLYVCLSVSYISSNW